MIQVICNTWVQARPTTEPCPPTGTACGVDTVSAFFDAPEYLARLEKRTPAASRESLAGLACLGALLRAYGLTPPFRLARDDAGRPYLPDFQNLDFNITHTENVAFCVLSDEGRVGIDAEYLREMKDAPKIAARFFSAGERQMEFFTAWTRKEAYLKYLGKGFSVPGGIAAIDTTAQKGVAFHTRVLAGCRVTVCTGVGKEVGWAGRSDNE